MTGCIENIFSSLETHEPKTDLIEELPPGDDVVELPPDDEEVVPHDVVDPPDCPEPEVQKTVYVCDCLADSDEDCVPGDRDNDGLSPDRPLLSYSNALEAFEGLAAGEAVAFCRGGSVEVSGNTRWSNDACRADQPCVIRDYSAPWGSGDEGRPIVHGSYRGFALMNEGDARHQEGYTLLNLDLRGAGEGVGIYIKNDMDDVMMCNLSIQDFEVGIYVSGSITPVAESDGVNERITVRNSTIAHNSEYGWEGGCHGCALEHNRFEDNGFAQGTPNVWLGSARSDQGYETARNIRIVGNEITRSGAVDGRCQAPGLAVFGEVDGAVIEGNWVHEVADSAGPGCSGISVGGWDDRRDEGVQHAEIRNNRVENVSEASISINACEACVVENNVLGVQGTAGIAIHEDGVDSEDLGVDRVVVQNNSLLIRRSMPSVGIRIDAGVGHVVAGNAIAYLGTESVACLALDGLPGSVEEVNHNLCYLPWSESGEWALGYDSLVDWTLATGFDADSIQADPRFVDADALDLRPGDGTSSMIDAGHPEFFSVEDRNEQLRDARPDVGAYEWIAQGS